MATFNELLAAQENLTIVRNTKKFSIKDFAAKEDRGALCGICHRNGHKIATDGMNLVSIRSDYPASLDGVVVMATNVKASKYNAGDFMGVSYPDIERFIRVDGGKYTIDVEKCLDLISSIIKRAKDTYKKHYNAKYLYANQTKLIKSTQIYIRFGQSIAAFGVVRFQKFLLAMKAIKASTVVFSGLSRALVAHGENGAALVMPVYFNPNDFDYYIDADGYPCFIDDVTPACFVDAMAEAE